MFIHMIRRRINIRENFQIYKTIGAVPCPYFGHELVYFHRNGFDHLVRKGPDIRSAHDACIRMSLLRYCKEILEKGDMIEHRSSVKEGVVAYFWAFRSYIEGESVELIVRQVGKGRKHFFSIFRSWKTQKRP